MNKWLITALLFISACSSYDEIICGQKIIWGDYNGSKDVCYALEKCTRITKASMQDDTLIEFISSKQELNSLCLYEDNVSGCFWASIDFTSDDKIYLYAYDDIIDVDAFCHEKLHESTDGSHIGFEWDLLERGYNG